MEYRKIPHTGLEVSTIGIGGGSIHECSEKELVELIDAALDHGVNLIDLAMSYPQPLRRYRAALAGRRDKLRLQMHLGMSFLTGEYARNYQLDVVKKSFEQQLEQTGAGYADIAFFHCIDDDADFEKLMEGGVWDYALELKKAGVIGNLGFSSHTVSIANRFIDTGEMDVLMFSVNPAYDLDPLQSDPYTSDSGPRMAVCRERADLYQRCASLGIGIQVMKAFGGGRLLSKADSPFGRAMTVSQCLQYALDRPAVLSCLLGVRSKADLEEALAFYSAPPQERDYAYIAQLQPGVLMGSCVYCNHCMPCPAGIDIGQTHKLLDLYLAGDPMAAEHYRGLPQPASACVKCGLCEKRCPFGVKIRQRMEKAAGVFDRSR